MKYINFHVILIPPKQRKKKGKKGKKKKRKKRKRKTAS
jgi:hypothetical protein